MPRSAKDDFVLCGANQIAEVVKRDARSVLDLIKRGELPAWQYSDKPNSKYYVLREDLEEWLRKQRDSYYQK